MADEHNQSLVRAHAVLDLLANASDGLGFADIGQGLGETGPATLSRMLKALMAEGFVAHDGTRYRIGPSLVDLARRILPGDRRQRLQALADTLADRCGQSALVCERCDRMDGPVLVRRCVAQREGGFAYGSLDQPAPLLCMGFGWPLLAELDETQQQIILRDHCKRSGETLSAGRADLAAIAREGVLVRSESLASTPLGCTRIVAGLSAFPGASIGISVIGRSDGGLDAQMIATWRAAVLAVARGLDSKTPERSA
jgi:DNA-binding IclR family transcriptional regulator